MVTICHRVEIPPHVGCLEDNRGTKAAKCRHGIETAEGVSLDTQNVVAVNLVSGRKNHHNGPFIGTWRPGGSSTNTPSGQTRTPCARA